MTESDKKRLTDLLSRLNQLEELGPPAVDRRIHEMAREAIQSEISRLVRDPWLSVYRNE